MDFSPGSDFSSDSDTVRQRPPRPGGLLTPRHLPRDLDRENREVAEKSVATETKTPVQNWPWTLNDESFVF